MWYLLQMSIAIFKHRDSLCVMTTALGSTTINCCYTHERRHDASYLYRDCRKWGIWSQKGSGGTCSVPSEVIGGFFLFSHFRVFHYALLYTLRPLLRSCFPFSNPSFHAAAVSQLQHTSDRIPRTKSPMFSLA